VADYSTKAFTAVAFGREGEFESVPPRTVRDVIRASDDVHKFYTAPTLCSALDIPFAAVFLLAIFFLDPTLCAIATAFIIGVTVFCYFLWWGSITKKAELDRLNRRSSAMIESSLSAPETIRFFGYAVAIRDSWRQNAQALRTAATKVMDSGSRIQTLGRLAGGVLTVLIVSVGAQEVVYGDLSIGALIGVNILAVRALGPIMQVGQLLQGYKETRDKIRAVDTFSKLPSEAVSGVELTKYSGSLRIRDVGFRYADSAASVFESVNLDLSGGQVLVVTGPNGSGKTTLARLFTGALEPTTGNIIVDGVNLSQIQLSWWRKKVMYLPQEPRFLDGSIRDNFSYYKSDISDGDIKNLLERVGLGHLVAQTSVGVDRKLHAAGSNLSLGMRRRLALARALTYGGPLAIFDEPTEGMDADGKKHVYNVLNKLASGNTTIICCSHDADIIRGAHHVIDLGMRPVPRISTVAKN
tara:strand:+ start:167 stop:1570 length:1404 start_codon:yes stop_codon:yes gene_type:complete